MAAERLPIKGRGAADNPANRFESLNHVADEEFLADEARISADASRPATEFFQDLSKSIVSYNNSPDVSFDAGINPYRGCEHGCAYCYARPMHEYLGFSAGLDFETKIMVKPHAAELLRKALASEKWKPQVLALSGATDAYQPVERKLGITRACLEVLAEARNPVAIVTKNHLVTRDIDLLGELAEHHAVSVTLSVATMDADLTRVLEPRTSTPARRLAAVSALRAAGVPVGVFVAPVVPGLTDHEVTQVVAAAADAGAQYATHLLLRLPHGVAPMFTQWLETHCPNRTEKVLSRVKAIRGGCLNENRIGRRMRGSGVFAEQIGALMSTARRKAGIGPAPPKLSIASFRPPSGDQLRLF